MYKHLAMLDCAVPFPALPKLFKIGYFSIDLIIVEADFFPSLGEVKMELDFGGRTVSAFDESLFIGVLEYGWGSVWLVCGL